MSDYHVRVRGPGALIAGDIALDCENDEQAIRIASAIDSPFGHELRAGERFLGAFERGWGELPPRQEDEDLL